MYLLSPACSELETNQVNMTWKMRKYLETEHTLLNELWGIEEIKEET